MKMNEFEKTDKSRVKHGGGEDRGQVENEDSVTAKNSPVKNISASPQKFNAAGSTRSGSNRSSGSLSRKAPG